MAQPSRRIAETPASATVRIADLAATLRRAGVDVVDFSAGRAAEHTPRYVAEAAAKALLDGDTHQTMARGKPEYRAACARKLARENGIDADPETEIIASMGCKQGLTLALLAVLDPGDEVIVEDPCFVSYQPTIRFCGGHARAVPLRAENRFRWRADELEAAITPRTRAILFCSPHNPTGVVHGMEELDVIADIARRHDLFVISDEIYERLTWGEHRHICIASLPGMRERSITLMGLTKSFSMGGWRIGFVFAPPPIISAVTTLQAHLMTCAGSFTQTGAATALGDAPAPEVRTLWRDWEQRVNYMTAALDALPNISCAMPEGGFYGWAYIRALGEDSVSLAERILRDHHVATVPGAAFGEHGDGYLRITCVRSWEDLRKGVSRLEEALAASPSALAG